MVEHKAEYEGVRADFMRQLQSLIYHMVPFDPALAGVEAKDCAYRIYRDTRFSPDKTPFKRYFSAAISPAGRHSDKACYYLQIDAREEMNGLYAGLWMPSPLYLRKMRHAIVDYIEEWESILSAPAMQAWWKQWCDMATPLKTAPAGWPKDHPQIHYLRLRDYGKQCLESRAFFRDPCWPEAAAERFAAVKPLIDFINYTLEEE